MRHTVSALIWAIFLIVLLNSSPSIQNAINYHTQVGMVEYNPDYNFALCNGPNNQVFCNDFGSNIPDYNSIRSNQQGVDYSAMLLQALSNIYSSFMSNNRNHSDRRSVDYPHYNGSETGSNSSYMSNNNSSYMPGTNRVYNYYNVPSHPKLHQNSHDFQPRNPATVTNNRHKTDNGSLITPNSNVSSTPEIPGSNPQNNSTTPRNNLPTDPHVPSTPNNVEDKNDDVLTDGNHKNQLTCREYESRSRPDFNLQDNKRSNNNITPRSSLPTDSNSTIRNKSHKHNTRKNSRPTGPSTTIPNTSSALPSKPLSSTPVKSPSPQLLHSGRALYKPRFGRLSPPVRFRVGL